MTQPATTDSGGGNVLATAAVGLALIAIEAQTRHQVDQAIADAYTTLGAAAVTVAATAPASVITGIGLLSLLTFHKSLTTNLDQARQSIRDAITTGYHAAANATLANLQAELGEHAPDTLPELGNNLDRLLADVDTLIGHGQTDLANTIAAAFDGIQGDNPGAARIIAIRQAVTNSQARTAQRAQAAAAVAVQAGAADTEQAVYNHFQNEAGIPGLMKRWIVTSADPCGMCEALNGTLVGVNAEFDHNATTNDKDYRRVWRNLLGPPRHPNCRCRLELVTT
jgi:hypothetical protein